MSTDKMLIPNIAQGRFQNIEGIPIQVISELFSRMQMPENLQLEFWGQVAKKEVKSIKGRVKQIDSLNDGTSIVHIIGDDGNEDFFRHPGDMTDQHLDEFKRAQNHGLKVRVIYQKDGDAKPINEIAVYGRE